MSLSSELLSGSVSGRPMRAVSACTSSSSDWTRGESPLQLSSLPSSSSGPSVTPLMVSVQEEEMDETVCRCSVCEGTFRLMSDGDEPGSRAGQPAEQVEPG